MPSEPSAFRLIMLYVVLRSVVIIAHPDVIGIIMLAMPPTMLICPQFLAVEERIALANIVQNSIDANRHERY